MSSVDKKNASSPFSEKELMAGKKKAFKVVFFLAVVSFFCMTVGIYINFFRSPVIRTVYYLTKQDIPQTSLLNPQPPSEKPSPKEMSTSTEEDIRLIQKLEKEHTDIEQTAEALREIVLDAADNAIATDISILPETAELQKLQQEKDLEDQKKLEEIEKLHQERLELESKKTAALNRDDVLPQSSSTPELPEKEPEKSEALPPEPQKEKDASEDKKNVAVKQPEQFSNFPPLAVIQTDLPHPDLIQTTLMESLPDFALIKKNSEQNAIPLHIIEPLPELLVDSHYGKLPIEKKGKTPFSAYGKSLETPPKTPYIAILFSGLGKRDNTTQAAIATLPDIISLSFSPYTPKLKAYISDARKTGHETLIDLPMQQGPFPEADPGPLGLVSGLPEQENRKRLHKVLGQNVAFIGVVAAPNENFSYSGSQMKPFFDEIRQRGLIYIDGTDNPRMPIFQHALRPDVHIADEFHRAAIRVRLERARKTALEKGAAFLRIEAVPITLLTTIEWMKTFMPSEQNPVPEITFVPLSFYASAKKQKEKEKEKE